MCFSYSLTLIDALDMLAIMGNYTEFRRVAELVADTMEFDEDINVSVFETNIRGAHFKTFKNSPPTPTHPHTHSTKI